MMPYLYLKHRVLLKYTNCKLNRKFIPFIKKIFLNIFLAIVIADI